MPSGSHPSSEEVTSSLGIVTHLCGCWVDDEPTRFSCYGAGMSQQQLFRLNWVLQMVADGNSESLGRQMSPSTLHEPEAPSLMPMLLGNQLEGSSTPCSYYDLLLCYCVDINKSWLDFFQQWHSHTKASVNGFRTEVGLQSDNCTQQWGRALDVTLQLLWTQLCGCFNQVNTGCLRVSAKGSGKGQSCWQMLLPLFRLQPLPFPSVSIRCWPCLIPCSPTAAVMRHVKLVPTFKKLCRPTFLQKTSLDENRRGLDLLMMNCKQLNHQIKIQIVKHDRELKTRRCPLCLLRDTD